MQSQSKTANRETDNTDHPATNQINAQALTHEHKVQQEDKRPSNSPQRETRFLSYYKKEFSERKKRQNDSQGDSKQPIRDSSAQNIKTKNLDVSTWGKLPQELLNNVLPFLNSKELSEFSKVARCYRQRTKRILLQRSFPVDFENFKRNNSASEVKINYAKEFQDLYLNRIKTTERYQKGKYVEEKNARTERLVLLFKEGRLADIQKENLVVTLVDLYNLRDKRGILLHHATKNRHQPILDYFYGETLKKFPENVDINHRLPNFRNTTLLHWAVIFNQTKVVETILTNADCQIDAIDVNGDTPFLEAVRHGHDEIAMLLINKGANLHAQASNGITALYLAAANGHLTLVTFLLERGANINQAINNGATALTIAADFNNYDVVDLLLQHGADMRIKDNGKTAFEWATDPGVKDLLLQTEKKLLETEIDSAIKEVLPDSNEQKTSASRARFFNKSLAESLSSLKQAVIQNDGKQIENLQLQFPERGPLATLYQNSVSFGQYFKTSSPSKSCIVM